MSEQIRLNLLGGFHVFCNGESTDSILAKSRKGSALMQYLILQHGKSVPTYRLIEVLWSSESSSNPESALKTLISRLRVILNSISPLLSSCIVTDRGSYRWESQPGVDVDLYEFEALSRSLTGVTELDEQTRYSFQRMLQLYSGNLLNGVEEDDWCMGPSVNLHDTYLQLVYNYLQLLEDNEEYDELINVCRTALDIDAFDERLHLKLMNALVKTSRNNEALMQYKHVTNLHFRYLGVQPPEGIQAFYKQIAQAGQALDINIDAIRAELQEYNKISGAFVCEYAVFKEIYNLQMRNLERLGTSMYLAMIMVSSMDAKAVSPLKMNDVMQGLLKVLSTSLRKGDTITQYSANQYALLLPMVNYETGKLVMERLKQKFYQKFPNSTYMLTYRIGPLSTNDEAPKELE